MSSRELASLAPPTGWKHAGVADDGDRFHLGTDKCRRRSRRMSMIASHTLAPSSEVSPQSSQSSAPNGSTTPSLPSTQTRSPLFSHSDGELSSVPGDLSDADYANSPKRRKIEPPAMEPCTEAPSANCVLVLKVDGEKLRTLEEGWVLVFAPSERFQLEAGEVSDDIFGSSESQESPSHARPKRKRGQPRKSDAAVEHAHSDVDLEHDVLSLQVPDPIPAELEHLVMVSQRLMDLSSCPIELKPFPVGKPEVWADGRQALCESLPYYRSYQSAGYCTGGIAMSFMFDQEGSPRDYMDSEVIIARSGGGLAKDKSTGKMSRQADQRESSQVKSVRRSMEQFNPVVMLCGNRNLQCPTKMPHVYNVLDWFKPTQIWAEKVNGKVNFRYRFEKLQKDKQSWWAAPEDLEPTKIEPPPEARTCSQCLKSSQQVYLQGWMCLQPDCPLFWKLDSKKEPQEAGLLYDPRFLKQHTPWPHASGPQHLRPELLTLGPEPMLGEDVSWAAAKGMACPKCGRCNSREAWEGWECGNQECDFTHSLPHAIIPANALHDLYNPLISGYSFSRDWHSSDVIPLRIEFAHNYRINYFTLPGTDGFIAHMIANKTVNEEPGGPDDMWTELQATDIGLRRRPLQCSTLQGPMLTQHFAVNYGMPYKFIAATSSHPFTNACTAITTTRSRLNWAAQHCVASETIHHRADSDSDSNAPILPFNELLALGYFERQSISYHDDGEPALGPTIATLSLGSPATMHLRLKSKHHHGVTKSGAYVDRAPIPGTPTYAARADAHAALASLSPADRKEATKSLPERLGLRNAGNAKDSIVLQLGHGDVIVMHGAEVQERWEHAVEPRGKLRFALTCRHVDPAAVAEEERVATGEGEGDGDGDMAGVEYDGGRLPEVAV